jgi:hypothetical protein
MKDYAKVSLDLYLFTIDIFNTVFTNDENDKQIFNTLTIVICILLFCN